MNVECNAKANWKMNWMKWIRIFCENLFHLQMQTAKFYIYVYKLIPHLKSAENYMNETSTDRKFKQNSINYLWMKYIKKPIA